MSAHTPGPWVLISALGKPQSAIATNEGVNIDGDAMYWAVANPNTLRDEWAANARLIAAAPDLLLALSQACALRKSLCESREQPGTDPHLENWLAVIAKATQPSAGLPENTA